MIYIKDGRLQSIDALRGVAALVVVLYHACDLGIFRQPYEGFEDFASLANHILQLPVSYGFAGIYLFFVISGFCIHLRWTKKQIRGKTGGVDFFPFWKRRIRRLYPAYLAALCFYLGFSYYNGSLELNGFLIWNTISHLLMIHNLI